MPINIAFGGSSIKRPGAYSTVDTSGMIPITLGAFNVLAFVGRMDEKSKIAPKTPLYFNSPKLAREKLVEGDFLEAVETAWAHGADLIAFVRADEATQATGTIVDGATTPVELLRLTTKDYGTTANDFLFDIDVTTTDTIINIENPDGVLEQFTQGSLTIAELASEINKKSKFVTAEALNEGTMANPTAQTNFSGGSGGGALTDADWQSAIDTLETEDVQCIVPVTTEPAVMTKVDAHVTTMSTTKKRFERRGFYGHAVGASISSIVDIKMALNNERALVASPAVYVYGEDGKELRASTLLASAYAGLWGSKAPQDPITYDYVKFAGLEKRYNSVEIEQLLGNGIAITEFVKGRGYRIVQGITTDTGLDLTKTELSVSTLKDVMSRNLRDFLEEKYVGKAGEAGVVVSIHNDVVTMLGKFVKAGWIREYVADSVQVVQDGTIFTVDWEGKPTLPINNFLVTSHFTI